MIQQTRFVSSKGGIRNEANIGSLMNILASPRQTKRHATALSLVLQKYIQQAVRNFPVRIGFYILATGQLHDIQVSVLGRHQRDIEAQPCFALLVVCLNDIVYLVSRYGHP